MNATERAVAAGREPGLLTGMEWHGIDEILLDELHDELAEAFIANAPEAAAYYLEGPDEGETLRRAA